MIIFRDEILLLYKWMLGHILEIMPGNDGNVRMTKAKIASNIFMRLFFNLCSSCSF